MSKALNAILAVGSIAALAIVTGGVGLGLAAGMSVTSAVGGLATYLGVNAGLLIGGALTGLSYLLGGRPSAPKPEQTETAVKSPTPARISGYGIQRLPFVVGLE